MSQPISLMLNIIMDRQLEQNLIAYARRHGGGDGPFTVLSSSRDTSVVQVGNVVAKAHDPDVDATALASRLQLIGCPPLRDLFLQPVLPAESLVEGRLVTLWPAGRPLSEEDMDAVPWSAAGHLLAALHRANVGVSVLACGAPARVLRATRRLDQEVEGGRVSAATSRVIRDAFKTLPESAFASRKGGSLVHGDWHLGQLVFVGQATTDLRMIDADDLGTGDPAWDLARPAAYFAAGLLPAAMWDGFLSAYRQAGGPAVPAAGDPWPALDVPARALIVQSAALAVVKAAQQQRLPAEDEELLIETCRRIACTTPLT